MQCLCLSGKPATACCLPIVQQQQVADTAEQLMRSRYYAFASANAAYLYSSWHPTTRPTMLSLNQGLDQTRWIGLQVLSHRQHDDSHAEVSFVASFVEAGQLFQLSEKSDFARDNGQWLYVSGTILQSGRLKNAANLSCPCGSGRKFKKCCALIK